MKNARKNVRCVGWGSVFFATLPCGKRMGIAVKTVHQAFIKVKATLVSVSVLCQSCILIDEKMINIKVIVFYVVSMIQNVKSYNNEQNVFQKSH